MHIHRHFGSWEKINQTGRIVAPPSPLLEETIALLLLRHIAWAGNPKCLFLESTNHHRPNRGWELGFDMFLPNLPLLVGLLDASNSGGHPPICSPHLRNLSGTPRQKPVWYEALLASIRRLYHGCSLCFSLKWQCCFLWLRCLTTTEWFV